MVARAILVHEKLHLALEKAGIIQRLSTQEMAVKILSEALGVPLSPKPEACWPPDTIERRRRLGNDR